MKSSQPEDEYAMVQHADTKSTPSSVCSFDGSETINNGMHGSNHDVADDRTSICSSELANMALGPVATVPHTILSPIQEDDNQAVSQTAPRMPGQERDLHVKVLLLGESGLGKTTLTHQLLRSYAEGGADIAPGHDGSSSSMEQFESDPDSLCTELKPVVIPDKDLRLLLKIQDVPGWGDDINIHRYLQTVMTYIMKQRAADYAEHKGHRAFPKQYVAGCLSQSVTACLYFLPPHRTKPVDLILMSALSQQVILIPVIAKADTMTQEETEKYRQEILDRCLKPNNYVNRSHSGIPELELNFFSFDIDDLQALQVDTTVPPFTIITSEHFDDDNRPVRKYLWGECDAANRKHSDFILLKRLLMGDKVNSLWRMLYDSYDRYVSFAGEYEAAGYQIEPLVTAACAACGPRLEYDDYIKSQTQVTQLQADKEQLLAELGAARRAAQAGRQVAAVSVVGLLAALLMLGVAMLHLWSPASGEALLEDTAMYSWAQVPADLVEHNMTSSLQEGSSMFTNVLVLGQETADGRVNTSFESQEHLQAHGLKPNTLGSQLKTVTVHNIRLAVSAATTKAQAITAAITGLLNSCFLILGSTVNVGPWLPNVAALCSSWLGIVGDVPVPVLLTWQGMVDRLHPGAYVPTVLMQSMGKTMRWLAPICLVLLLFALSLLAFPLRQHQNMPAATAAAAEQGLRTCLADPRVDFRTRATAAQQNQSLDVIWQIRGRSSMQT